MCLNLNLGIPSVGYDSDMQGCICRLTFTFLSNVIYSKKRITKPNEIPQKTCNVPGLYNPTILFAEIAM